MTNNCHGSKAEFAPEIEEFLARVRCDYELSQHEADKLVLRHT